MARWEGTREGEAHCTVWSFEPNLDCSWYKKLSIAPRRIILIWTAWKSFVIPFLGVDFQWGDVFSVTLQTMTRPLLSWSQRHWACWSSSSSKEMWHDRWYSAIQWIQSSSFKGAYASLLIWAYSLPFLLLEAAFHCNRATQFGNFPFTSIRYSMLAVFVAILCYETDLCTAQ